MTSNDLMVFNTVLFESISAESLVRFNQSLLACIILQNTLCSTTQWCRVGVLIPKGRVMIQQKKYQASAKAQCSRTSTKPGSSMLGIWDL